VKRIFSLGLMLLLAVMFTYDAVIFPVNNLDVSAVRVGDLYPKRFSRGGQTLHFRNEFESFHIKCDLNVELCAFAKNAVNPFELDLVRVSLLGNYFAIRAINDNEALRYPDNLSSRLKKARLVAWLYASISWLVLFFYFIFKKGVSNDD